MQRRLQDYARLQRGSVKAHEPAPAGEIARLFPKAGYGFIKTFDGREVYFHRNALVDGDLADLAPGTRVEFVEEQGEEGPQATAVHTHRS
jgi:cold shock CspA family protein